jgi:hypothetical protein
MTDAAKKAPKDINPKSFKGGLGGIGAGEPLSLVRYDMISFKAIKVIVDYILDTFNYLSLKIG